MISWPKKHHEKITWAKSFKQNEYKHNKNIISKNIFNGDIIFNYVTFNYPDSETIIDNLYLAIKQNESIGIIGSSGSGKSTLIDLLTGIIKPKKGEILVSGKNIKDININYWRQNLGIVMQENYFKNGS